MPYRCQPERRANALARNGLFVAHHLPQPTLADALLRLRDHLGRQLASAATTTRNGEGLQLNAGAQDCKAGPCCDVDIHTDDDSERASPELCRGQRAQAANKILSQTGRTE